MKNILKNIWRYVTATKNAVGNILFIGIILVILFAVFSTDEATRVSDSSVLLLQPHGVLVEKKRVVEPFEYFLNAGDNPYDEILLRDVIDAINFAQKDERITGMALELSHFAGGSMSQLQEIGIALQAFKDAGKPVLAYAGQYSQKQYYLASFADEVYLDTNARSFPGGVFLRGLGAYNLYLKSALEKIHAQHHVFQEGKYKSAVEIFSRDEMSDAAKEATRAWLNTLWDAYLANIREQRDISADDLMRYINDYDSLLQEAHAGSGTLATNYGLVDGHLSEEEWEDKLDGLGSLEGSSKDSAEDSSEGSAEGSLVDSSSAEDSLLTTAEGSLEDSLADASEDASENSSSAEDSLLKTAEGSSLKTAEGSSLKTAEGSSLKTAEGSSLKTAEGSLSKTAEGSSEDTLADTSECVETARISMDTYLSVQRSAGTGSSAAEQIGVVVIEGVLVDGEDSTGNAGADSVLENIRRAKNNDAIKALVVRINSPGGQVSASELIRSELVSVQDAGKPVVVSMAGVAASGGYWIASSADMILASDTTITGSIGVFSLAITLDQSLAQLGIHPDGIGTTAFSSSNLWFMPINPAVKSMIRHSTNQTYKEFVNLVATGRGISYEEAHAVAQGRVWAGATAFEHGLIDKLGTLDDALAAAAQLAELDDYKTIYLEKSPSPSDIFIQELIKNMDASLGLSGLRQRMGDGFMLQHLPPILAPMMSPMLSPGMPHVMAPVTKSAALLGLTKAPGIYAECLGCQVNF